jgi:F0F1-type ATP synthase membrane subunit b/b'
MISLDFTSVLVFFAFLVFVQLFKRTFFDKVAAMLAERKTALQQAQEEADSAVARYLELEITHEATMQEAHMQAKAIVSNAQQLSKKQLESGLLSARESLEAEFSRYVDGLHQEKHALLQEVLKEKQVLLPLLEQRLVPQSVASTPVGSSKQQGDSY